MSANNQSKEELICSGLNTIQKCTVLKNILTILNFSWILISDFEYSAKYRLCFTGLNVFIPSFWIDWWPHSEILFWYFIYLQHLFWHRIQGSIHGFPRQWSDPDLRKFSASCAFHLYHGLKYSIVNLFELCEDSECGLECWIMKKRQVQIQIFGAG